MVTLTTPHKKNDSLTDLLSSFKKALTQFHSNYQYKFLIDFFGIEGHVRSLEITYSIFVKD